tara:strand:- start:1050 stop:1385 length:336 start_codon:yes stop_codon:yes gene_type:complete
MSRLNKFKDNFTRVKDKKSEIILNELIETSDNKSLREQSKQITDGKAKPKFLGRKGSAVYQQEYFSFVNQKNRDHNWKQKFKVLTEELQKNDPDLLSSLKIKYQFLNPNNR